MTDELFFEFSIVVLVFGIIICAIGETCQYLNRRRHKKDEL